MAIHDEPAFASWATPLASTSSTSTNSLSQKPALSSAATRSFAPATLSPSYFPPTSMQLPSSSEAIDRLLRRATGSPAFGAHSTPPAIEGGASSSGGGAFGYSWPNTSGFDAQAYLGQQDQYPGLMGVNVRQSETGKGKATAWGNGYTSAASASSPDTSRMVLSSQATINPYAFLASYNAPLPPPTPQSAASLDKHLESPLGLDGLGLVSPFLGEDGGEEVPGLDQEEEEEWVQGGDFTLFPATSSGSTSTPFVEPAQVILPRSRAKAISASPQIPSLDSNTTSDTAPRRPSLPASLSSSSSTTSKKPPTGFRGRDTSLIPLDAPVQSRNYVLPSRTSRKRKSEILENERRKARGTAAKGEEEEEEVDEDAVEEVMEAVEKKRRQNTISARKSRARKQLRLTELENENDALRAQLAAVSEELEVAKATLAAAGL
ncbi:transcription factor [Pseudohyphozyma bogoriensis]|nr:transcription factor [Pseudohyphozyma bogoriensis]